MKRTSKTKASLSNLPDSVRCIIVKPFPFRAITDPVNASHDLGEIQTPEQMAQHVPPIGGLQETTVEAAAKKTLAALVGSGPAQTPPHSDTALLLREGIARLRDHALSGDVAAMEWLGFVLNEAVADLGEMARRHPEIVRQWSRKQNMVPVLAGRNKGHRDTLASDLDAFAVGEASPYRINPKTVAGGAGFSTSTPVNALAGALCEHLNKYRHPVEIMHPPVPDWARMASNLDELSTDTWEDWADAAWECLLSSTNGEPEKWSDLGDDRDLEGKGATHSQFKSRLKRAFRSVAKN